MTQVCPGCSVETGDSEVWCPKCGARLGVHEPGIKEKLTRWGFILFNVVMGGVFISTMHGTANSAPDHVTAALSATMVIGA